MLQLQMKQVVMPFALLAVASLGNSLALKAAGRADEPQTTVKKSTAARTSPESGKELFQFYCASCHGKDAKGGGPAAFALKNRPADLTLLAQKNGGKFPTENVMNSITGVTNNAHGDKEMPVWGPILSSKSRVRQLAKYIESLQVK